MLLDLDQDHAESYNTRLVVLADIGYMYVRLP